MTDGVTELAEAQLNKYIGGDGAKLQIEVNYAHIRYTGSVWEVATDNDSCDIVSGDCVWSTDHLTIAIDGYTVAPLALATRTSLGASPAYHPSADGTSTTNIDVYFHNASDVHQTTEGVSMDFGLFIIGL